MVVKLQDVKRKKKEQEQLQDELAIELWEEFSRCENENRPFTNDMYNEIVSNFKK